MDIAIWAREYFGKSLSLNTVCPCIKKLNLKLYYAINYGFINFVQKHCRIHCLKSSEMDEKTVEMWSDESTFQLVFEKMDVGFHLPKMKKAIQTVANEKCKNQPL